MAHRLTRISIAAALLVSLGGCAVFPRLAQWTQVTPVRSAQSAPADVRDAYYADAVAAIERRDYARALDALQAARERNPRDFRVLNAFGVVYDKLGRFDLSARYYAQAGALDAGSPIIEANQIYSAQLQARAAAPILADVAPSRLAPEFAPQAERPVLARAAPAPAAERPAVIRLGFVNADAGVRRLPLLTGRPLEIADASGRGGGEPVRQELARLGWSAPPTALTLAAPKPRTVITYPSHSLAVAEALARTLPAGVQLVDCADACGGIRLTLGRDALTWRAAPWSDTLRQGD